MFKEEKGITLVALVITIIVLLILAGVSISLVVGQNGVLTQSQSAVKAQKASSAKETVSLALASLEVDYKAAWATNQSVSKSTFFTVDKLKAALTTGYTTDDTSNEEISSSTVLKITNKNGDVFYIHFSVTGSGDSTTYEVSSVEILDSGSNVTVNNI